MIKLVVTDIDDTLVNSRNEISEKNREVIEKCKEQDIKVILASGRPDFGNNMQHIDISTVDENKIKEEIYENFKPILKELEENKPFISLQWIFNWVYRDRIK